MDISRHVRVLAVGPNHLEWANKEESLCQINGYQSTRSSKIYLGWFYDHLWPDARLGIMSNSAFLVRFKVDRFVEYWKKCGTHTRRLFTHCRKLAQRNEALVPSTLRRGFVR
jgi:hypothetical protein